MLFELLVHLTVSPALMVIGFGLYPELTIVPVTVFGGWVVVVVAGGAVVVVYARLKMRSISRMIQSFA